MIIKEPFLERDDFRIVYGYAFETSYYYGESDVPGGPVTGMVSPVKKDSHIWRILEKAIEKQGLKDEGCQPVKMYFNCFAPGEKPLYHQDEYDWTYILYINPYNDADQGGETFFIEEDTQNITGVLPRQNRLVKFKGSKIHKANSYKNYHRFSLTVKYGK